MVAVTRVYGNGKSITIIWITLCNTRVATSMAATHGQGFIILLLRDDDTTIEEQQYSYNNNNDT